MKIPFSALLSPLIKSNLQETREFCELPTFTYSLAYTYFYAITGLIISGLHFRKHFAEVPQFANKNIVIMKEEMVVHDYKVISSSMGVVQYTCLVVGCVTENPALFLPHIFGQLLLIIIKMANCLSSMADRKALCKLKHRIPSILIMSFNLCQEFCVFRKYLCLCDL